MRTMENFHRLRTERLLPNKTENQNPKLSTNISLIKELMENNEKDLIISNQKTYIYQLELKEKNFDELNQKYINLQYEYDNLINYKNQLELEMEQKDNHYNRDISLLNNENDCLKIKQNDVLIMNKKLIGENDYLKKELELKNKEILRLNQKINECINELNISKENQELYNKNEMEKLLEDNHRLYNLCQELNYSLQEAEKEKENLNLIIKEKSDNIDNLNLKLNEQDQYYNEQIDIKNKIEKNLQDVNIKIIEYEKENAKLKNNISNEENKNKLLNEAIIKKDNQIDNLNKNYEELLKKQDILNNDIINQKDIIKNYMDNCKILKEQNNKLMNEIHNIISFNQKFKIILNRKEIIKNLIDDNKLILKESLKNIDETITS